MSKTYGRKYRYDMGCRQDVTFVISIHYPNFEDVDENPEQFIGDLCKYIKEFCQNADVVIPVEIKNINVILDGAIGENNRPECYTCYDRGKSYGDHWFLCKRHGIKMKRNSCCDYYTREDVINES